MSAHNNLRLTAAGRAAIADETHVGTSAVTFTALAIGAGSAAGGAGNDSRTALRDERDRAAVGGAANVDGQIGLRADFQPSAAYQVTEAGLFGRIGSGGAEQLMAYWTDGGTALAAAVAGATLTVAGVLQVQAAAAEVTVTPDISVTLGDPGLEARVAANEVKNTAQDGRLDALETEQDAQDTAIAAAQAALALRQAADVTQDSRLDAVETKNTAQDGRLDALDTEQDAQDGRLDAVETKNTAQDGRLDALDTEQDAQDGRLDAVETKNTAQDGRLDALDTEQDAQDSRLDAVETKNTAQDGRLDALDTEQDTQDASIAALQTSLATLKSALTALQAAALTADTIGDYLVDDQIVYIAMSTTDNGQDTKELSVEAGSAEGVSVVQTNDSHGDHLVLAAGGIYRFEGWHSGRSPGMISVSGAADVDLGFAGIYEVRRFEGLAVVTGSGDRRYRIGSTSAGTEGMLIVRRLGDA